MSANRFFSGGRASAIYVEFKYLREKLSIQMTWEALVRNWALLAETGKPPSYATTRRYLRSLPAITQHLRSIGSGE